jgi:hypothetical protein
MPLDFVLDIAKLANAPEEEIARVARINLADLTSTMETHAALYGFAAARYERAKVEEIQAKAEVERTRADVFLSIAASDPSMAVNRLERRVETSEELRKAITAYHTAARNAGDLKALVNALDHRRDMIVQIASRQKKEM